MDIATGKAGRLDAALIAMVLLGLAAALCGSRAAAQEVRVSGDGCASAVHLVAHDAPLSDVLKRLAATLGFDLTFTADTDPRIDIDSSGPPAELVARLAPTENISLAHKPAARCAQGPQIANVWVLPRGAGARTAEARAQAAGKAQAEAERARLAQAGVAQWLEAHGGGAPAPAAAPPAKQARTAPE